MVEPGFVKADFRNLPVVDTHMIYSFISGYKRFNAEEIRGSKAVKASRKSYGDVVRITEIGYVCLKGNYLICIVKARTCPEHKVKSKAYSITLIVDEEEQIIQSIECHGCAALLGDCKHAFAFLIWMNHRTKNPSPTEIECYWKKPRLASVGSTIKFIKTSELCKNLKSTTDTLPDNSTFLTKSH